jgi:hypothetical protein
MENLILPENNCRKCKNRKDVKAELIIFEIISADEYRPAKNLLFNII